MVKLTINEVNNIRLGDILAKYPLKGDMCIENNINENEVEDDNIYYLIVESISPTFEYVLACSILGFGRQITSKLTQTRADLVNGFWWSNISLQE